MGVRMASDDVAAALQVAQMVGVQKGARSEKAGGDKKMAFPIASVQFFRRMKRAPAAVIERQQNVAARFEKVQSRNGVRRQPAEGDSIQVACKGFPSLLVTQRGTPLKTRFGGVIRYVVVQERGDLGLSLIH